MAIPFLDNVDLNLNELYNAKWQLLASDPGSPANGQVWINTTSWTLKARLNGVTVQLGRLDQMSAPTASLDLNSQKIINLATPTGAADAVTKAYVDGAIQGFRWKDPVRVATTANGALATAYENGDTIDGVTLATNDRILIKDQTAGQENGIYTVNASGAPTRAADANTAAELDGAAVIVLQGTTNAGRGYNQTADSVTLETTPLVWALIFGGPAGGAFNKFSANVGDGAALAYALTHSFGTRDVQVGVYRNSTPWDTAYPAVERTDANTVTVRFAAAPTTNQWRVVVTG